MERGGARWRKRPKSQVSDLQRRHRRLGAPPEARFGRAARVCPPRRRTRQLSQRDARDPALGSFGFVPHAHLGPGSARYPAIRRGPTTQHPVS